MPYIGNPIYQAAFVTDQFSGDGTTTAFTMSVAPAGTSNVLVVVSGVVQDPSTYSVVGTTLTFTGAPPSGTGNISCRYLGVPASGVTTTAYRTVTEFTATASQTTFTPASYNVGFINVYQNGVLLGSADYTATNGTTVVLATGATAGDLVTVESFLISSVSNAISNTAGSVSSSNIIDGGVTTAKIADDAVDLTTKVTGVLPEANGGTGTTTGYYGFKNRIINGAMVVSQRNGTSSVTASNGTNTFFTDRFKLYKDSGATITGQQSTTAPTGFSNSLLFTVSTGSSPTAGQEQLLMHIIEGYNVADLGWGTATAATVTLSFQVRSSVTGTFSGALQSASSVNAYVFNYTISAANTWETKTITVAGPTTGTWLTTNGAGLYVIFDIGSGSTYETTPNVWTTGNKYRTSGAVQLSATTGATWYVTGVQLEKGSTATSFDYRPYGTELALCQRYYQIFKGSQYLNECVGVAVGSGTMYFNKPLITSMRTSPTFTSSGTFHADGTSYNAVTLTMPYAGTATVRLDGSGSGWTAGQGYALTHQSTDSYLSFSAEL